MTCSCESRGTDNGGGHSLAAAFEAMWPASLPYPPRAPWLVGLLSRGLAMELAGLGGARAAALIRRGPIVVDHDDVVAGYVACPECPDGSCFKGERLTDLAADYYNAGGSRRDLVDVLYRMLGEEWCASDPCRGLRPGDLLRPYVLTNCELSCVQIYKIVYPEVTWAYFFLCCCTKVYVDDDGPFNPEFDPPWDDDTPEVETPFG